MFWGIVSSVLSVLNTFAYQRAISAGVAMGAKPLFRTFYNNVVVIAIILALFAVAAPFGDFVSLDFRPYFREPLLLALAAGASLAGIGASLAGQYAYSNERAGVLAPYSETGRLLTIVGGFFIFANQSYVPFTSAIVAVLAIVACSIDFKSLSVNRYCAVLAASGFLRAFASIAIGYVVTKVAPFAITMFDVVFAAALCLAVLLRKKWMPAYDREKLVELTKWTAANDGTWIITFIISLLLLKSLGIVTVSLLGMLTLVLTVVVDAVRSKKLPPTKISALAVTVAVCVGIGSFFR